MPLSVGSPFPSTGVAHDSKKTVDLLLRIADRLDLGDEERSALHRAAAFMRDFEPEALDEPRARGSGEIAIADPRNARAVLYSDGAARGNPGPAGIGAVLKRMDGTVITEISEYIGETTNNVAEYRALIAGVERALNVGVRELEVRADSELLIRQLQGQYQVRNAKLKPLYHRAQELLSGLASAKLVHVRREFNSEADRLANLGIDAARRARARAGDASE